MLNWILANPTEAGAYAGVILGILLAAFSVWKVAGFRQGLLALMLRAERARRHGQLGPVDGPQVMDLVIQWALTYLVPGLPAWLRPVFTPDRIRAMAQGFWNLMLDLLDDGLLNGTRPVLDDELTRERRLLRSERFLHARAGSDHKNLPMFPVDLRSTAEKELPTDDPPGAA